MIKIYKITNTINTKLYIGLTSQTLRRRFQQHIYAGKKTGIGSAITKYGVDNFTITLVTEVVTRIEANNLEKALINTFGSEAPYGYNIELGGDTNNMSEDTKRKIGLANLGKKRTKEFKQKMRNMKLGTTPVLSGIDHESFTVDYYKMSGADLQIKYGIKRSTVYALKRFLKLKNKTKRK